MREMKYCFFVLPLVGSGFEPVSKVLQTSCSTTKLSDQILKIFHSICIEIFFCVLFIFIIYLFYFIVLLFHFFVSLCDSYYMYSKRSYLGIGFGKCFNNIWICIWCLCDGSDLEFDCFCTGYFIWAPSYYYLNSFDTWSHIYGRFTHLRIDM